MAYTRIHAIKRTLQKALDYIENPEKTEDQMLVSAYNVDPRYASLEYAITSAVAQTAKGDYTKTGGGNNLAYHLIQSFSPEDKVTPEQAHEIGKKLADELLDGKYEYVISTHVDKGHVHNHIIFNATSFIDFKKFETIPYKTAARIRKISDRLCEEYGLSIIRNPNLSRKSPSHFEWEQQKKGTSWKAKIRKKIDAAIEAASSYEAFVAELQRSGVEIKDGQRISFRLSGTEQERFVRGDRIGDEYSRNGILQRLQHKGSKTDKKPAHERYAEQIEILSRKEKKARLAEVADALLTIRREEIRSDDDFTTRIDQLKTRAAEVTESVQSLREKHAQYAQVWKYLRSWRDGMPIAQERDRLRGSKREQFAQLHAGELAMFERAGRQLQKLGVKTEVDPDKLQGLLKDQDARLASLEEDLKKVTTRIDQLRMTESIVRELRRENQLPAQARSAEGPEMKRGER